MKHLKYLRYILVHKWWVMFAAVKMRLWPWNFPGLWCRLLVHDWSKLLPSEWVPYANSFYGGYKWEERPQEMVHGFDMAWLRHQHRNDHHWQHWVLIQDDGEVFVLEMPLNATLEMVCDWAGAGKAITGRWKVAEWYAREKGNIVIHDETRKAIEGRLAVLWADR